ncbi:MAG TPA: CbtA family protein [Bryobacteraceae bacterium]
MSKFRQLMVVCLVSGALTGLVSFAIQHFTVIPLIQAAETYETAAHAAMGMHEDEGWQPSNGWQRTSFTALATMLSGIGYAAVFFGVLGFAGTAINLKRGALLGIAAFACVGLAPALGLPPQPPGVPVADLQARQLWWLGTAAATATGLWLVFGSRRNWVFRIAGVICITLPHLIGAPPAPPNHVVPTAIVHKFELASLATTGVFWLLLGAFGGWLQRHFEAQEAR